MQSSVAESTRSSCTPRKVVAIEPGGTQARLIFEDETSVTVSRFLASFVKISDRIEVDPLAEHPNREVLVTPSASQHSSCLYLAPLAYVTQPKRGKREEYFLRADIPDGRLNIKQLILPNSAVRDYFYFANRRRAGLEQQTLYQLLRVDSQAKSADLRLALKVRLLELEAASSPRAQVQSVERAFNLLARPDLRACYDVLLLDPEAPVLFPYGGFGSILVAGELSTDRETLFARRIVSFLPEQRQRRFRALLRQVEFFDGYAIYRDSRRKLEMILDPILLPVPFDPTWNQWRHLVGTKFGVEATFVRSGKIELRGGEWRLRTWETALPSRTEITPTADAAVTLANAQQTHHRFGQFFDRLEELRLRLEREPIERSELVRICEGLGLPLGFDVAQISWRADFERFYYAQILKRSRKMFLFRDEFIFELEKSIVVEIPQQGHATYVFSRPVSLAGWLRYYAKATREDIRNNRENVAERLGFVGRVNHGQNPRRWVRELRQRIGEPVDYCLAIDD